MASDVETLVIIGHLYIFREMSVQILCPFLKWIVFLTESLYILDTTLPGLWIFLSFFELSFTFLIVSFEVQKF